MATTLLTEPPPTLVRDPVCGMELNPAGAAAWRVLDGQTHYFCAERCARQFDRQHPGRLAGVPAARLERAAAGPAAAAGPQADRPAPAAPALPAWVLPAAGVGLVAAVLAVTVFGVSPGNLFVFAIVLACPLMHLVMMRGMGHGGHAGHGGDGEAGSTSAQQGDTAASQRGSCH